MLLRWDKNGGKKGHDMAAMTWSKLVHAQVHIGLYHFFEFNCLTMILTMLFMPWHGQSPILG
jgi:hypothetical protein